MTDLLYQVLQLLYQVFQFSLITLACCRITHFVTTDTFPPIKRFREWVAGSDQWWGGELISCNWCAGTYITLIVYAICSYFFLLSFPLITLQIISTMYIIGWIGDNH